MENLQAHRIELTAIAVALVAVGAGAAYYFYLNKKPKGTNYCFISFHSSDSRLGFICTCVFTRSNHRLLGS